MFAYIVILLQFCSARFNNTLQVAMKAGEDSKVQQGLFENFLEAKVKDPHLILVSRSAILILTLCLFNIGRI